MKATTWHGRKDVRVERVDDPRIEAPTDAIVRVTSTAICESDLHLYNGFNPTMKRGDILGHEFMGEVVETGTGVTRLRKGARVVVAFDISCGSCFFCEKDLYSCCETTNPNRQMANEAYGTSGAALFGYSHMFGGFAGGQAELVRVPHADVGCLEIPDGVPDEKVLFLGDILSTAWMAAENCGITRGDTVAVWGAGPVGLLTLVCARLQGAGRVISIDTIPERLALAKDTCKADVLDYEKDDVVEALKELTSGRGPDAVVEAVGMEAHATGVVEAYDRTKHALRLEQDRPHALRQAIQSCRMGGTVSVPGVYTGFIDKLNMGSAFAKGLTFKMGQTHVQKYMGPLLELIVKGEINPSFIITHPMALDDAPRGYEIFEAKEDACIKVVLKAS